MRISAWRYCNYCYYCYSCYIVAITACPTIGLSWSLYAQAPWPTGVKAWWYDNEVFCGAEFYASTQAVDVRDHDSLFWIMGILITSMSQCH